MVGKHGLKLKVVSYLGTVEVSGCWTIPTKAHRPRWSDRAIGHRCPTDRAIARGARLSCPACVGSTPLSALDVNYIPPRESQVPVYIIIVRQQPAVEGTWTRTTVATGESVVEGR